MIRKILAIIFSSIILFSVLASAFVFTKAIIEETGIKENKEMAIITEETPGFEAVFTIVVLLFISWLVHRKENSKENKNNRRGHR